MYDLLIVGAGITAATLVARLKHFLRICVIDCRHHLGGNCYDDHSDGTNIHRYGPHIFHCPNLRIKAFLDAYTEWVPYTHQVVAEIRDENQLRYVPFPYCDASVKTLGRQLTESEILTLFFRDYSQKMWGMPWENLPLSVRKRVPRAPMEFPTYYRDEWVALPRRGYTHMMENMFDGVELILEAPPLEWTRIAAKRIVYTGRPDLIPMPKEQISIAKRMDLELPYRTLDIQFSKEHWELEAACLHACSSSRPWTRKTCFSRMTGGNSLLVSTETPRVANNEELSPFYPIEVNENRNTYRALVHHIRAAYPRLELAGRLGTYRYFDMYHAVGQALSIAERLYKLQPMGLAEPRSHPLAVATVR